MVYLMPRLTNLLFFGIPLFYCYTNLNLSIICFLFSGDMYLFLGVALFTPTSVSLFCDLFADFFCSTCYLISNFIIPIESPVASVVFWIALFDADFIASVVIFLVLSRSF